MLGIPGKRSRQEMLPVFGRDAATPKFGRVRMEIILVAAAIAFIAFFVVMPAVWSKDPDRRASARDVLRMILTAFGRRPV